MRKAGSCTASLMTPTAASSGMVPTISDASTSTPRRIAGRRIGSGDGADQAFIPAAPNFLQLAALIQARGLAVVVDGDMQLLPQPRPEIVREVDADAHR